MTYHMCLRDESCKTNINLNSKTCIVVVNNATLFVSGKYSHNHEAGYSHNTRIRIMRTYGGRAAGGCLP